MTILKMLAGQCYFEIEGHPEELADVAARLSLLQCFSGSGSGSASTPPHAPPSTPASTPKCTISVQGPPAREEPKPLMDLFDEAAHAHPPEPKTHMGLAIEEARQKIDSGTLKFGDVSEIAEKHGLNQSTFSYHVAKYKKERGMPLLTRYNKKTGLTQRGTPAAAAPLRAPETRAPTASTQPEKPEPEFKKCEYCREYIPDDDTRGYCTDLSHGVKAGDTCSKFVKRQEVAARVEANAGIQGVQP